MKVLVTGGGGFLGSRICELFAVRGDEVTALGRNRYPHLERQGIRTVQLDLWDNPTPLRAACRGMDVVVHSAARTGIWGKKLDFQRTNIGCTLAVLEACWDCGVRKLVCTSSPSVVFGDEPLCGVDESQPYPKRYLADYPASKAAAERLVLADNGPELATVALRPHLIFGPGDPHLFPRIMARAQAGRLFQVGDGTNRVDVTYIDNAANAHVLAADALDIGTPCSGKAYFISQGEPVELWPWLEGILAAAGVPKITRRVSYPAARRMGAVLELVYRVAGVTNEPPMTRFLAAQLAQSHYFSIQAAQRDLGYQPQVSTEEGVRRLVSWLKANR
jgi:nucleoside-diphosphate-sugar epimerase